MYRIRENGMDSPPSWSWYQTISLANGSTWAVALSRSSAMNTQGASENMGYTISFPFGYPFQENERPFAVWYVEHNKLIWDSQSALWSIVPSKVRQSLGSETKHSIVSAYVLTQVVLELAKY
jgi:hypothetical protein